MRQFGNKSRAVVGRVCVTTGSDMIRVKKKTFPPGARVTWNGDGETLQGIIRKVFTHRLERTMKGATVTCEANKRNPAYLIEQDDGDTLLMQHNQLRPIG